MRNILERLEKQLKQQFPDILENINPAAAPTQLEDFEAAIKQRLPDDVRALYSWRNGSISPEINMDEYITKRFLLINQTRWCSLSEALNQWHLQNEVGFVDSEYFFTVEEDPVSWHSEKIRPWTAPPPTWLPVGRRWWNSWLYVDLLPGPQGCVGQLVQHTTAMGQEVIAPSISAYFSDFLDALENKKLNYDLINHRWYVVATAQDYKCA